jgi:hypothetical protein
VDTFTASGPLNARGTVRGASGDSACATAFLSDCGTYCATNCWPYCSTGNGDCKTLNTCNVTGECCKPTTPDHPCEM